MSADETIYLMDLGVKIDPKNNLIEKKEAALAKRHVKPKLVNVKTIDVNLASEASLVDSNSISKNSLEKYNLGNKYFLSGRYVEAITIMESIDFNKLSPEQQKNLIILHSDALFQLGHYNRVANILLNNNAFSLNDELLFLLALSSLELGSKKGALEAFYKIVNDFPESEYVSIAKL